LFGAGYEAGGVAFAAGLDLYGDGVAGDAAGGFDDLLDGEAAAVAEVEDHPVARGEGVEGEDVGVGEVGYVDVVADAGAVGGGIVFAEDEDLFAAAEGNVEDEGDDVGFGLVGLAAVGEGSGYVEVAEGGVAEAVEAVEPAEHMLDEELGFAVGVRGSEFCGLFDGGNFRFAVDGGGGGED